VNRANTDVLVLPVVALTLVAIVMFASAMWTGILRLNAVVETGEVNIAYRNVTISEASEVGGKDVGNCIYTLETGGSVDRLKISISNGYPGYKCIVTFNVVNTGTIPVIGPFFNVTEIPHGVRVVFNPPSVQQLHPGDLAHYEVVVEVLQEASENSNYTVDIEITYIQWNEAYSSISGYVWNDVNSDEAWNPGEDPVEDVNVLLRQDGVTIGSTYTSINGYYSFMVYPGTYVIEIVVPPGYTNTTTLAITRTVSIGESSTNNNFGIVQQLTPPPPQGLSVWGEFRETDVDFRKCPAKLGTPLDRVNATVSKTGEVISVAPGAFYYVLWVNGTGLTSINITLAYDYQFNIEDGAGGKIRVYMLNTTTMCITKELDNGAYTYSVNNTLNRAIVNITLSNPLPPDAVILVYTKFKPTHYDPCKEPNGLIGHRWDTLDKSFEVNYNAVANVGSLSGASTIQIVKK